MPKTAPLLIVGSEKWLRSMESMPSNMDSNINGVLVKIGAAVSTEAKKRVPVGAKFTGSRRPGALKNSIRYEIVRGARVGAQVRIGTNIRYAPYIEYGTNRIARGKVKALGRTQLAATDATAIRTWKSKTKRGQGGAARPIMPFLRPAANAYAPKARFWMSMAVPGSFAKSGFLTRTGGGA